MLRCISQSHENHEARFSDFSVARAGASAQNNVRNIA